MDTIKHILLNECTYRLSEEIMDRFLGSMTEIYLKPGEVLIEYGKLDNNMYVLKSGIIRFLYFDGLKEKTYGFCSVGTLMLSYHSYYMRLPSFFQVETCTESVVLKISKRELDDLIAESHEFSTWLLTMMIAQLYVNEFKLSVLGGTARERFEALVNNRPDIMENVSLQTIASYLGITPSYLSRLKKKLSYGPGK